jgi:hypothetical protein
MTLCTNCNEEITKWSGQWFHIHNSVTFCQGKALNAEHQPAPVAEPIVEEAQS